MNSQPVENIEHIDQTKNQRNKTISTINSTDALSMIEHSSELTLTISTPVGTKFSCRTPFIGTYKGKFVLIEIPSIPPDDLLYFFQEGFWMNVRAISPRGEGALIIFRSQLMHILQEPIALALLSIPNTMQVSQLRKEPRFELNLAGKVAFNAQRSDCELRDLSRNGCRFITPPLGKTYQVGDMIALEIFSNLNNSEYFPALSGKICNLQRSLHYARYGMEFDENGRNNATNLLAKLKFNGTKLTLNTNKKS